MPTLGELRERIIFKEAVETSDGAGGTIVDWDNATVIANAWAKVEPIRGREAFDLGIQEASLNYRVWTRYLSTIKPQHRIFWGTVELDILSVQNFRGEKIWLEIMALHRLVK